MKVRLRSVSMRACAQVVFYAARYDQRLLGIFEVGDCTDYIAWSEADIAILEEPEHLTWFHHGERWTGKFQHVVSRSLSGMPQSE